MAIYTPNGLLISNTDMIGLDTHNGTILFMGLVDVLVPFACSTDDQKPQVGQLGCNRAWDASQMAKGPEIRNENV